MWVRRGTGDAFVNVVMNLQVPYNMEKFSLGYYIAYCGNFLPTFRDNMSVPTSWVVAKLR